jgi:hypothetical protein
MKRMIALAALLAIAGVSAGCSRVLGEAASVGLGAKNRIEVIQPLAASEPLGPVTVNSVNNTMGSAVADTWPTALAGRLRQAVAHDKALSAGKRPVEISGDIVHAEGAGLVGQALGPDSEVVVRVKVKDAATGVQIGEANVVGRARGSLSSGQDDLSEAFAKGVVKWLHKTEKLND